MRKATTKTNHRKFLIILLFTVLFSAGFLLMHNHLSQQSPETICGTIIDAAMNTMTVQSNLGEIYDFYTGEAQITTEKSGILLGNTAEVTFCTDSSSDAKSYVAIRIIVHDQLSRAEQILSEMTLEEKVGQMFMVRCPDSDAADKVSAYHLGGYILFAQDFADKNAGDVRQMIQSYQANAAIPLLIGVDEEGGTVNRISINPNLRNEPFYSSQELFQEGGYDLIYNDTKEKCGFLRSLGINVNFAPVCDVSTDPNDYIYKRSFGQDASATAEYVATVIDAMKSEKIGSVLKHFPGYGNNTDTHNGIAYDERTYEEFVNSDFLPFSAGISHGADIVLVSHNIVNCFDADYPASLSPKVHEILREQLGFDGVIITDDLFMNAIKDFTDNDSAAVLAVKAGNDLICCKDFEEQIPAVLQAVQNGEITEERLDESVLRILNLKINLGLLE